MNGTIASIFVGKMLGEEAVAATANANQIMFIVFAVVFGFAMAATILVGQASGRKDIDEVRRTTGASMGFFFIAGVGDRRHRLDGGACGLADARHA